MKSQKLSCLLLLLFSICWSPVNSLCSLDKLTSAHCHELEDARYIDTYHLLNLRAPCSTKTITPGNFKNLTSLKHLDLSDGKLEMISSNAFAKLESLQTLNLANNHISHLEVGAFDGLKQLHSLKLQNNAISKLPAALMSLKRLKLLDLANNPLDCDCASMKLRDSLVAKGVKITKQTLCSKPISAKNWPITKPNTEKTCSFEEQDREMQADQAVQDTSVEGSGEEDADAAESTEVENNETVDDKEEEKSKTEEQNQEETAAPEVSEATTASTTHSTVSSTTLEEVSSSTAVSKDDITFDDSEDSSKKSTTESSEISIDAEAPNTIESENSEGVKETDKNDDLIVPEIVPVSKEPISTEVTFESSSEVTSKNTDDIISQDLGSGEEEGDDGSGSGGVIDRLPGIDFNISSTSPVEEEEASEDNLSSTTSATSSTTASYSLWSIFDPTSYLMGSGSETKAPEPTESPTERGPEMDLKEEQYIPVTLTTVSTSEVPVVPAKVNSVAERSHRVTNIPTSSNKPFERSETAYSKEPNKGMNSYIVLAVLLGVLVTLIIIAAYKGEFCRKKSKRRDVEKGTEMKDMQKSLLDQSKNQPKIQVTNGSTLENVPLMTPAAPPEEPKDNQRSYDIAQSVVKNGSSYRSNGHTSDINDPVKPPRKPTNQEIEAPLNGLNPPMDAIDGPTSDSLNGESIEGLNGNCCERPPLSPGAQRVKITLNENLDSVVKTPVLITRINDLVTTP